jgi:hypothetical protein
VPNDRELTAVTHAMADIEPGLRLHVVTTSKEPARSCSCMASRRPGGNGTHGAGPHIGAPRCPRGGAGSFEDPAPPFGGQLSLRRLRFG